METRCVAFCVAFGKECHFPSVLEANSSPSTATESPGNHAFSGLFAFCGEDADIEERYQTIDLTRSLRGQGLSSRKC